MTAILCGALLSASAQEQDTTIYEFRPHWYIQGAFGYQYTIGETKGKALPLSSPNAQIAFGYNFTPVWGLRVNVNGWQSRDGYVPNTGIYPDFKDKTKSMDPKGEGYDENNILEYKWYYVAPAVNVTMDLTNLIGGYKHNRICNVGIFLGGGVNVFFKNDEAWAAYDVLEAHHAGFGKMIFEDGYIWGPRSTENSKAVRLSPLAQAGLFLEFRVTDKFRLGLEGQGNLVHDRYNSKHASNPDWYINALVTAKYNIGGTYNERTEKKPMPCDQLAMAHAAEPVHDTVYIESVDTLTITNTEIISTNDGTGTMYTKEPLRVEIFFPISSNHVSITEYMKVKQIVNYMEENPDSKVVITGYADKATGTAQFNKQISEKRANVVKDELINKYGISADRITAKAMGDTEQPHADKGDDPLLNRVSICVVE